MWQQSKCWLTDESLSHWTTRELPTFLLAHFSFFLAPNWIFFQLHIPLIYLCFPFSRSSSVLTILCVSLFCLILSPWLILGWGSLPHFLPPLPCWNSFLSSLCINSVWLFPMTTCPQSFSSPSQVSSLFFILFAEQTPKHIRAPLLLCYSYYIIVSSDYPLFPASFLFFLKRTDNVFISSWLLQAAIEEVRIQNWMLRRKFQSFQKRTWNPQVDSKEMCLQFKILEKATSTRASWRESRECPSRRY